MPGPRPAARQRITAKASCRAWLPITRAATRSTRRKSGAASSARRAWRGESAGRHGGLPRGPRGCGHPARREGGEEEEQAARYQDAGQAGPGDRLAGYQGRQDEGGGARTPDPAIGEGPLPLHRREGEGIGQGREAREGDGLREAEDEQRREAVARGAWRRPGARRRPRRRPPPVRVASRRTVIRPATGPVTRRISVPAASTIPIS